MNSALPNVIDLSSKALDSISLVEAFRSYNFIPMVNGELILKQNNLGSSGVVTLCSKFPEHLAPLKKLDLSSNKILDVGAKALASYYLSNPDMTRCLQVLHLGFNNITFEGMVTIIEALKSSNLCLQDLSLRYNEIGAKGFQYEKAESLFSWLFQNVQSVDLTGNGLRDIGAKVICNVLLDLYNRAPTSVKLERLNLWANDITDEAAVSIAMVLRHTKCSLRVLDLSSNNMNTEGVQKIYDACVKNTSLEDISMYGNDVKDRSIFDHFKILAKRNADNKTYQMQSVFGDNNRIPVDLNIVHAPINRPQYQAPQPQQQPQPQQYGQYNNAPQQYNFGFPSYTPPQNYHMQQPSSHFMPPQPSAFIFHGPQSSSFPVHPPMPQPVQQPFQQTQFGNPSPNPSPKLQPFPTFGVPQKKDGAPVTPPAEFNFGNSTTPTSNDQDRVPSPANTKKNSEPASNYNVINPLDQSFVAFDSKQNQLEVKTRTVESEHLMQISEKQFKEMESKLRQQEKVIAFLQDLLLQKANMKISVNYQ